MTVALKTKSPTKGKKRKKSSKSLAILAAKVRRRRAETLHRAPKDPAAAVALGVTIGKIREKLFGDAELIQLLSEALVQAGSIHGLGVPSPDVLLGNLPSQDEFLAAFQRLSEQLRRDGYEEGFEAGQQQALTEYGLEALARVGEGA